MNKINAISECISIIENGRDMRKENLKEIVEFITPFQVKTIVSNIRQWELKTPKDVMKAMVTMALVLGFMDYETAKRYSQQMANSWAMWNFMEMGDVKL